MLILNRRPGESIHIGDRIVITVLDVKGQQVQIGIDAPREISVDRAEIRKKRQAAPDRKVPTDESSD